LLDWRFVVLSHNTIRGAAGAAVLNAEVLARAGKLDKLGVPKVVSAKAVAVTA
jgi:aspartate-semialdehyde dehydrogenase